VKFYLSLSTLVFVGKNFNRWENAWNILVLKDLLIHFADRRISDVTITGYHWKYLESAVEQALCTFKVIK
jgi:hypothetical protein